MVRVAKPYLDQFTSGIVQLRLEKTDVRRYVMREVSLLAE